MGNAISAIQVHSYGGQRYLRGHAGPHLYKLGDRHTSSYLAVFNSHLLNILSPLRSPRAQPSPKPFVMENNAVAGSDKSVPDTAIHKEDVITVRDGENDSGAEYGVDSSHITLNGYLGIAVRALRCSVPSLIIPIELARANAESTHH